MPFGENRQKGDCRLDKLSVEELDVAGSWNQIIGARRNASNGAIFPSPDRLVDDRVNNIGERPYRNGGAEVCCRRCVRHGGLTAIAQDATRNTLDGRSGRYTGTDYGLTDVGGRKMSRDQ